MKSSEKTIGIFGGTFDPVHNGHLSIARSFLNSGLIDELWVFLSPFPPHKDENGFTSYAHRYKMLTSAFEPLKKAVVSDLEKSLPKPSYTVKTVSYLTDKYPDYSFYLCMGKDSLLSFHKWHKWRGIIAQCPLLVADRPTGSDDKPHPELSKVVQYVDHEPIAVSSTQIRRKIEKDESVAHLVPDAVARIINKEHLYHS